MCWLFPNKTVTVNAPCLCCGEPVRVAVRDGQIEQEQPQGVAAFVDIPFREWRPNLAHS